MQQSNVLSIVANFVAITISVIVGGVIFALIGVNPILAFTVMLKPLQSNYGLSEVLLQATPFILMGVAVAICLKAGFWNIGAEGHWFAGAMGATYIAIFWADKLPDVMVIPVMFATAMTAGGVLAIFAAILKVYLNVNEIISTLMLNFLAFGLMEYTYFDAWRDPTKFGYPGTETFPISAQLPRIYGRVTIGLFIALVIAMLAYFLISRTKFGWEIKTIGLSKKSARYFRIPVEKRTIQLLFISGGLAGLAAAIHLAGISHKLQTGMNLGYGYIAIAVALLGLKNPLGVILAALLIAIIFVGGDELKIQLLLPNAFSQVILGVIIFFTAMSEFISGKISKLLIKKEISSEPSNN